MKLEIILNVNEEDYKLLKDYGFYFEKNFENQIKEVAEEMRYYIKKNKEKKKQKGS